VQIALQTLETRFLFVGIKEHWTESIDCFRCDPSLNSPEVPSRCKETVQRHVEHHRAAEASWLPETTHRRQESARKAPATCPLGKCDDRGPRAVNLAGGW
jgi:hypothetical protein